MTGANTGNEDTAQCMCMTKTYSQSHIHTQTHTASTHMTCSVLITTLISCFFFLVSANFLLTDTVWDTNNQPNKQEPVDLRAIVRVSSGPPACLQCVNAGFVRTLDKQVKNQLTI